MNDDSDFAAALGHHVPGDRVRIVFVDRGGRSRTATVTLAEDPHLDVVPVEMPTAAQRAFRGRWLSGEGNEGRN